MRGICKEMGTTQTKPVVKETKKEVNVIKEIKGVVVLPTIAEPKPIPASTEIVANRVCPDVRRLCDFGFGLRREPPTIKVNNEIFKLMEYNNKELSPTGFSYQIKKITLSKKNEIKEYRKNYYLIESHKGLSVYIYTPLCTILVPGKSRMTTDILLNGETSVISCLISTPNRIFLSIYQRNEKMMNTYFETLVKMRGICADPVLRNCLTEDWARLFCDPRIILENSAACWTQISITNIVALCSSLNIQPVPNHYFIYTTNGLLDINISLLLQLECGVYEQFTKRLSVGKHNICYHITFTKKGQTSEVFKRVTKIDPRYVMAADLFCKKYNTQIEPRLHTELKCFPRDFIPAVLRYLRTTLDISDL